MKMFNFKTQKEAQKMLNVLRLERDKSENKTFFNILINNILFFYGLH